MSEREHRDFEPDYQTGKTQVEHRNIDAAGEDHPFGDQPREFTADLRTLIRKVADDLYDSWEATVREYLANAETATLKVDRFKDDPSVLPYDDLIIEDGYEPKIEVTWNKKEDSLVIKDNGIGMAAVEVDEIFRKIGHSAARDVGNMSGQFGMGALSFVKMVGLDNSMIMMTHSRINDDNAAYLVSLAGVEPIRGSLDEDEYGTKFQLTPKDDFDIRGAVERYSEWMRVPVIYREVDENGQEIFNEDWGDRSLLDSYDNSRIVLGIKEPRSFTAYCSPEATGQTLLLSMDIERNAGSSQGAPFPIDTRILDESGKVVLSDNGNEGLMPCPRSQYESMLVEARDPYITEDLLNNRDIVGQDVEEGPNEGQTVVADDVLEEGKPLPPGDYITKSGLSDEDEPGETRVLIGPNQGRTVVPRDEWDEMDDGRAELYIPEDELESFDIDSESGDLTLPEPTSDRSRLQEHPTFWEYIGKKFVEQFDGKVEEVHQIIEGAEDPISAIEQLDPEDVLISEPRGLK